MPEANEHELTARARRGERQAFGLLVSIHQEAVFNVCYRLLGQRQAAEDLAQETFLRAFQRFDSFQVGRPFGPWTSSPRKR